MKKESQLVQSSAKSYLLGCAFSLVLILLAYFLVESRSLSGWVLDSAVAGLALLQAWVLLFLFINLRNDHKPRWNLIMFLFMVLVTILVVFGSLWIMYHLNYNLMGNG